MTSLNDIVSQSPLFDVVIVGAGPSGSACAYWLSQAGWSLSNLASMLRLNLFTYRDLTKWLADPMETPPLVPAAEQLTLVLV